MKNMSPAKARYMRLRSLYDQGDYAQAAHAVATALGSTPKDPNILHLGADIAMRQGDFPRAVQLYARACAVVPDWFEAHYNLGLAHGRAHHYADATAAMTRAGQLRPQFPPVIEALAQFAHKAGDLKTACQHWAAYLELVPSNHFARGQYHVLCRQICDWRRPLPLDGSVLSPHAATALLDDPMAQKAAAQNFAARQFGSIQPLPAQRMAAPQGRALKIGYLSSDFHAHATAYLMAELFALHDPSRVQSFAYSYGPDDGSAMRRRIQQTAGRFVDIRSFSAQESAERIRRDGIDILIDMKGYTRGGRLDICAYRPAPLQGHWLGYPGTLGAPFMDFLIADLITVPPMFEDAYTETILRMPHTYQINDRTRAIGPVRTRAEEGLPDDARVLASFNQTQKITPEIFALWCGIMAHAPDTVLWLFESNPFAVVSLQRAAEDNGIDPARLIFAPPLPLDQHLARYAHVDLALDTYPYGGHTTTSDALWAGVPVVTLIGQGFASRVAASLLFAADMGFLVAESPDDYASLVCDLLDQPDTLARAHQAMATNRESLPLFDSPQFVRDFENLLHAYAQSRTDLYDKPIE